MKLQTNKGPAASMGPRTYIRGNVNCGLHGQGVRHASMGPRTYIRGNIFTLTKKSVGLPGMNGAADLHARKLTSPLYGFSLAFLRQWGSGLTPAAKSHRNISTGWPAMSSIRPQSYQP